MAPLRNLTESHSGEAGDQKADHVGNLHGKLEDGGW